MYRDIIKNTSVGEDDFEFERMTNLAAVVVHLNAQGDTSQAIPESSGLVTNSILFSCLFTIKDRCAKVRFQQTYNQGLHQL